MGGSMSSVVISGNTSGAVTLTVPDVAGTNTLTLPASTGTVLTTGSPQSGGIIQVVNSKTAPTQTSTSSTTFVTTGFSLSITPKFATSKIYLSFSINTYVSAGIGRYTIYRGATDLQASTGGLAIVNPGYSQNTITLLDSPATTSSTTYTLYMSNDAGGIYAGLTGQTSVFTLMEVAA